MDCIRHLQTGLPVRGGTEYTTSHQFEPRYHITEKKNGDVFKKYVCDVCVFCGEVKKSATKRKLLKGDNHGIK